MVTRSRPWFACLFALGLSCSDPFIVEDTARGCSNRYDDDGNGLVDCADPSCVVSGVCEVGAAACRDGRDNDRDGRTDCQQTTCISAGYCEVDETSCAAAPQGGCLAGQGCYLTSDGASGATTYRCRLGGMGARGDACDAARIATLGPRDPHPCAIGLGCSVSGSDQGVCTTYCNNHTDCPAGGLCLDADPSTGRPGSCTVACNPLSGLGCHDATLACRSYAELLGQRLGSGGARFLCAPASSRAGLGRVGSPCDDPATAASSLDRVCGAGSVCAPSGSQTACHASCIVGGAPCAGGARCLALYPGERPSAFDSALLGYCE